MTKTLKFAENWGTTVAGLAAAVVLIVMLLK